MLTRSKIPIQWLNLQSQCDQISLMVDQNPQNYRHLYADVFLKEHALKETPVSALKKNKHFSFFCLTIKCFVNISSHKI